MSQRAVNVDSLSPKEQLELLEQLWDRLSRNPEQVPVTDPQRRELDSRLADLDDDVVARRRMGIPWDEVLKQIRSR
jgi:putative addiction module component (TIGR02574 family)